jgi:mannosyltransferase OCH1-like enzyme
MRKCVEKLKTDNPEFEHHLYDEPKCREYIKTHFSKRILNAYDKVVPYALKADLWRYCIIYNNGGIYIDSKYYGINNFKFIQLIDKEYFCTDIIKSYGGIYNAILICKPHNPILLKSIQQFVKNAENNYYGSTPLCIGPLMMKDFFTQKQIDSFPLKLEQLPNEEPYIKLNGKRILQYNKKYAIDKKIQNNHWTKYWQKKKLYN